MFGVRGVREWVRECSMFGVRVRECSWSEGGSAPMFGVRVRECSNVWG